VHDRVGIGTTADLLSSGITRAPVDAVLTGAEASVSVPAETLVAVLCSGVHETLNTSTHLDQFCTTLSPLPSQLTLPAKCACRSVIQHLKNPL
jgi:hypothetical protein